MENDNNMKTAYPCDEPEERRAPAHSNGEAFYYGNDKTAENDADAAKDPAPKGKGRRGGNAAASLVVHSGNFRKRPRYGSGESGTDEYGTRRGNGESDHYRESDRRERYGRRDEDREQRRQRRDGAESRDGFDRDRRRSDVRSDGRRQDRYRGHGDKRGGFSTDQRDYRRDYVKRDSFETSRRDSHRRDDNFGRRDEYERYRRDRGERGRDDRGRGERGRNPEAVFDRAYSVTVTKTSEVGAFVSVPEDIRGSIYGRKLPESKTVLLPFSEQIGRPTAGETIKAYFYEDKGGRITATMRTPILRDGEVGILTVADVTSIGAFLDNGVPKQVLLPFKEQIVAPKVGDEVLVWLYSDKSGRQAATMRVYGHLDKHSPYKEDDRVTGFVYEINPRLGIFVAVDNRYYGLVPMAETFKEYAYGDEIEARVAKVREDGKLDLLIRDKLYKTVEEDAEVILYELRHNDGFLPYGDRADAAFIEETYAMSKNQFKRALGHLYRNRVVELDRENDTVRLIKEQTR